ncbi:MAG: ATP-binding protein, partial [Chloroflexi bacterium]|nr:ATP-binding protein [Chloroflexota bacterium]
MLAMVRTAALVGLEGHLVEVQVDIAHQGLPNFFLVGLPSGVVREARERVRTAIKNSGLAFPLRRITVNLAPAELPKNGPSYDLPLALALLVASEQVGELPQDALFVGELGLDGQLRHTEGVLPMAATARAAGVRQVFVPAVDAPEAALLDGLEVVPVNSLAELVAHVRDEAPLRPLARSDLRNGHSPTASIDLADVRGQEHAKRALEIAAAGNHNLLLTGPPGSGKTLLARALPGILPPMTIDETLEVTRVYSVAGLLQATSPAITERPFRAPHHTASYAGLVGGGMGPRPGEISLA